VKDQGLSFNIIKIKHRQQTKAAAPESDDTTKVSLSTSSQQEGTSTIHQPKPYNSSYRFLLLIISNLY
jgi:hypothetical protein